MRPLLAATLEDPKSLPYPVLVSPKYDGFRVLKFGPIIVSRNLKPIRNKYTQECLKNIPEGLDGELIVGAPNEGMVFNRTSSGVTAVEGEPDFKFYVFDMWNQDAPYVSRYEKLCKLPNHSHIEVVTQMIVHNVDVFLELESTFLLDGYEGIMIRGPHGKYKQGRATNNEQILWKFKRFRDGDAEVLGIEEGVMNLNAPEKDALGYTTRSTKKENKVHSHMLGTILARDLVTDEILRIAPGRMEHTDRELYWRYPGKLIGRIVKYKVFDYGKVNTSRFCTYQGIRDPNDL